MRTRWGRRAMSYSESVLSTHGCLYTFLGLYTITNILLFLREAFVEAALHTNFRRYLTPIARGSGAIINFNSAVVLVLASRSTLKILRSTPLNMVLPIDKAMPDMHRIVGIITLFAAVLHTAGHLPWYFISNPWGPGLKGATSLFVTGVLLLACLLIIRLVARPAVLNANYELFFRTHISGSIVMYGLLIAHGMHRGSPNTWKYIIGPVILYVLDVASRIAREKRSYLLLTKHSAACQGLNIVKIRLPRVFHYEAGQYAEIKVPQLSRFQWHPFTIASAPHEPEIVFYIKAVGDWTKSLYQLFSDRILSTDGNDIEIHIRGPYGAPAQHVGQFDRVILIGGGVGATPFCSVVKDAYYWIKNWIPRQHRRKSRQTTATNKTSSRYQSGDTQNPHSRETALRPDVHFQSPESSLGHSHNATSLGVTNPSRISPSIGNQSWHLFTTNVISERIDSERNIEIELSVPGPARPHGRQQGQEMDKETDSGENDNRTFDCTTMHTARDYLAPLDSSDQEPSIGSHISPERGINGRIDADIESGRANTGASGCEMWSTEGIKRKGQSKLRRMVTSRSNAMDEDGLGTYYGQSTGSHHPSLDYISALHSMYGEETDEVFQKSLGMMVGMSLGSVSLVRNMQLKKAQKNIREGRTDLAPAVGSEMSLDVFKNPWIMFLLYMRSVTVNMMILWLIVIRFTVAGGAFTVNAFKVFHRGIQLYEHDALNAIDLTIGIIIVIALGLPSIVEAFELGAAPLHWFDLFVLTPIALFGVMVDIFAFARIGRNVDRVFNVFHVFVIWPVLTILVLVRLLRVIGERITQVESMHHSHSTTRAVDFFWTAPTADDDQWLVGELMRYTDLREVRLHRYLTRAAVTEGPEQSTDRLQGLRAGCLQTCHGRPNWSEIFNEVAERSRNNSTIGVFFCGPLSMALDVKTASREAMRNSIVRGLQSGVRAMRGLEEVFGEALTANEYTGDMLKANESKRSEWRNGRGCNVTIVFKRESFS